MVRSILARYFYSISIALLFLLSGFIIISGDEAPVAGMEPTRAGGPIVNKSMVIITLLEGFNEFSGEHFFGTGQGSLDLFFDPSYDWKEGDIQYPHKAFEVKYPRGYDKTTTPIEVKFVTSHYDTSFATATVTCQDDDFNSYIYGQDHFKVTITAWNSSGSSEAELWFEILNVNDAPTVISTNSFFSIAMDEDSFHDGINEDNDQLDDIFGDNSDPDDVLTFTYQPMNDLAKGNITVDLAADGSSVIFTPVENWACPYVPSGQRLSSSNTKIALYKFICSDQEGDSVNGTLRVYVGPVNDVPVFDFMSEYTINEGVIANIQFEAIDADPANEQELRYGTNITTIMYEKSRIQLEFEEGYSFDTDDGILQFNTENKMVGVYPVSVWVDDRPSKELGTKADYPTTPYKIYSNFTLNIVNKNDPPTAQMGSPSGTFVYNTVDPIEFNASRTLDPDLIHGQVLTYNWFSNGELIGEGMVINHLFPVEGVYDIDLNVSDGEFYSELSRTISVEKTRILGEPFEDKDIELDYNDNVSDALVLHRTQEDMFMEFGGKDSIDLRSIIGFRDPSNPKIYKIKVTFGEEMSYLYTEQKQQEPVLTIYFLKPDFSEVRIAPLESDIPTYSFPVPYSNFRYNKLQVDLRNINVLYYPLLPEKTPGIRQLDTKQGVEITLTVAELDQMSVEPDFIIYATVEMKSTITNADGQITIIRSWDAGGYSAKIPQVDAVTSDDNGEVSGGIEPVFIILPLILVFIVIVIVVIVIFFVMSKKKDDSEPEIMVMPAQQSESVEHMIFGDAVPPPPTAEQLYGAPQTQSPGLPPAQPEGLPPGQLEQAPQTGEVPPQVEIPPAAPPQPATAPPPPAEQPPAVTLPE